ncbi:hypothetical protein [Pedobacter caeni]|uniref:hypothetical protein n=1 Tax=Pedobacter caeni TaxID=288992 RepID=UPI0011611707|nr:hypothetical protein [Pedobacter caeni]
MSDFQKKTFVQIREAYFRERNESGELVFEVEFWSSYFTLILDLFYPDYRELPIESTIHKYHSSNQYDEDTWGDENNGEVEIDRLEEFYGHMKSIVLPESLGAQEVYNAIIEICESAIKNKNKLYFIADY